MTREELKTNLDECLGYGNCYMTVEELEKYTTLIEEQVDGLNWTFKDFLELAEAVREEGRYALYAMFDLPDPEEDD